MNQSILEDLGVLVLNALSLLFTVETFELLLTLLNQIHYFVKWKTMNVSIVELLQLSYNFALPFK